MLSSPILEDSLFYIGMHGSFSERGKYTEGEVNIHFKSPVRYEELEALPEEELRKR